MSEKTIILVDSNNLAKRMAFALKQLSTGEGQPTGAIYGFLNALKSYIRSYDPEQIICFWDTGKAKWRKDMFPGYKIGRTVGEDPESQKAYEDFVYQVRAIQDLLQFHPVQSVAVPGCEADDLIANFILFDTKYLDYKKILITMDEDFFQLLSARVNIYSPSKEELIDVGWLQDNYGVTPQEHLIQKSFTGDGSDDIPGFPGIGAVGALKIIREVGGTDSSNWKKYIDGVAMIWYAQKKKFSVITKDTIVDFLRNYKLMNLTYGAYMVKEYQAWIDSQVYTKNIFNEEMLYKKMIQYDMRSFSSKFIQYCAEWKKFGVV